jgi:hypothetical protein
MGAELDALTPISACHIRSFFIVGLFGKAIQFVGVREYK